MTGQSSYKSFLKQVNKSAASDSEQTEYVLLSNETTVIGRDPSLCNIVLDSTQYPEVSRKHLKISPQPSQSSSGMPLWEVCDLGSRNGIYINGQRLESCQTLQVHDCIKIGHKGPEFIFECQAVNFVSQMSLSDIFPIRSTKVNLRQTGYLVPGVITVIFVVAMLATQKNDFFPYIVAAYLVIANEYIIHKIAHKHKPWWLLLSVGLATGLAFLTCFPHDNQDNKEHKTNINIPTIIFHAVFQEGLLEELFKAVPVLLVYLLGRRLQSPKRELIGVSEPLDGILLGTASATGFALVETFIKVHELDSPATKLTLLIPLILGDIFGQVAYSGYFGYFIGLSAMKPSKRWRLLGIGYLTSATIHTLWAVVYEFVHKQEKYPLIGYSLLAFIGSLAYVFLIAATLKAHHLSPNRSQKSGLHGSPISH